MIRIPGPVDEDPDAILGIHMALSFQRPTLSMPTPTGLLTSVANYLRSRGWGFEPVPGAPALASRLSGRTGDWSCAVAANDADGHVAVLSIVDVQVRDDRRIAMAEFLTRLNYGLGVGNFEMDFADGEIRCKTATLVDGTLSSRTLTNLLRWNADLMDRYAAKIIEAAVTAAPE